MPSQSLRNFEWNLEDVQRLVEAHNDLNDLNYEGQGRRALGHITRSALVMLCAAWELYFEDIIVESVKYVTEKIDDPHRLPPDIKKKIINFLNKNNNNDLRMFRLAGEGWKEPYIEAAERDIAKFNTPKSEPLGVLCKNYLGLSNISSEWSIGPDGINDIISQRGEIAHRGREAEYISLQKLIEAKEKIYLSVLETDFFLATHLKDLTNATNQPWRRKTIPEYLSRWCD